MVQMVENLPAMQETQVGSLGLEDVVEKEMAIHSSILGWKIPWTEESGGLQSRGSHMGSDMGSDMTEQLTLSGRYSYDPLLQMRKLRHRLNGLPTAAQRG